MKKIFLLLLFFISVKAFAQYPTPTGVTRAGNMLYFYKVVGPDTLLYGIDAHNNVYPIGRTNGGGGSDSTLYKTDGTLPEDRTVTQNEKQLNFLGASGSGPHAYSSQFSIKSNQSISDISVAVGNDATSRIFMVEDTAYAEFGTINDGVHQYLSFGGYAKPIIVHAPNLKADSLNIDTSKMTGFVYPTANKVAAMIAVGGGSLTLTGDITGSGLSPITTTLATVNSTPGSYGDATHVATFTTNGKGLTTASGSTAITFPVNTVFGRGGAVVAAANDYTFAQLASKPTTLSGYGITDAYPLSGNPSGFLTANQTISFSPTGDVTGSTTGATSLTPVLAIGSGKVTNTMLAGSIAASKLVGTDIVTIGTLVAGSIPYSLITSTPSALPPNGTAAGELAGSYPNPTLLNSAVMGKVLTGYTSGAGIVASTDNVLQAFQKLNGNDALKLAISDTAAMAYVHLAKNEIITGAKTFTKLITVSLPGIGISQTAGLLVSNPDLATVGVQKNSPIEGLYGNGWKTASTAGSQPIGAFFQVAPSQGTTNPGGTLNVWSDINGTQVNRLSLDLTNGNLTTGTLFSSGITNTGAISWTTSLGGAGQNIYIPTVQSDGAPGNTNYFYGGATGVTARVFFAGNSASAASSGFNMGGTIFGTATTGMPTASSGVHPFGSNVAIMAPLFTLAGSGTISDVANLFIDAAATVGVRNWGLYVKTSNSFFGGNIQNSALTASQGVATDASKNLISVLTATYRGEGQTTLVAGTKAISVTGVTTSSHAFVTLVTPSGTSLTTQYQAVCTSGTVTIQANVAAGTINISDVSVLNYFVTN